MSYTDSSGVIINELTEEQLKAQETLPPNQYWLTPEEDFATVGLPLGMIIPSAIIQNSSHLHLLDGASLPSAGIYAKFYEWAVTNSQNVPSCTEEEYEADLSTYGQCGKFVIGADYIKLPTITEFIASSNGGEQIGLAELDSFKNHTHGIKVRSGSSAGSYNGYPTMSANSGTTQNVATGVVYESNIGGDETKPKNIRYPYYIVVATGTKTDVEVNIDNIATDLNSKVDLISNQQISGTKNFIGSLQQNGREVALQYPIIGKEEQISITTTAGKYIYMSDYINTEDYIEGGIYEIYLQGYAYSQNSRKTSWGTDLLPSTTLNFNTSDMGRQNGWVGVLVASQYIFIDLNGDLGSGEYFIAHLKGYRRLF